jgi:hypothetical protein
MIENKFSISKVIGGVLFLLIAALVQLKLQASFSWTFDLLIVVSLLVPLFLTFSEFVFFYGFYFFLFSGLLLPGTEKAFLLVLPAISLLSQNFFPWQSWFSSFFMSALGIGAFYLLISAQSLLVSPAFMLFDLAISSLFGWGVFLLMRGFTRGHNL